MPFFEREKWIRGFVICLCPALVTVLDRNGRGLGEESRNCRLLIVECMRQLTLGCQIAHRLSALGLRNAIMR